MEQLLELLKQIQELTGVAVDAVTEASGGGKGKRPEGDGPPEGGKPPGGDKPAGGPDQGPPPEGPPR